MEPQKTSPRQLKWRSEKPWRTPMFTRIPAARVDRRAERRPDGVVGAGDGEERGWDERQEAA